MALSDTLPRRRIVLLAAALFVAALGLGLASLFYQPQDVPRAAGKALVGGPFTAINQRGETVTEKDFAGRYMLMFFGFTTCPDVCPTQLQVMSEALNQMGADGTKITPVFVTIDPERDTPDLVRTYVESFDSRFVGLTGSPQQIAAMARTFRIFYQKVENPKDPANYTMDHSSIIYLMGPDGSFVRHFPYTTDPRELAGGLKQALETSKL